MIRHIVMFTWKPGTPASIKEDVLKGFAHMKNTIEHVIHMECGNDQKLAEGNYDFAMIADFADKQAWSAYRTHPEHLAFVKKFGALSDQIARIQIEI
ncbi:MAG: Dabb family protein [Aquincola sp.]|nr:Dabb family protein [Aquincola sp.]MDH4287159.1 Dabb family protein [Aquincola sp.]MDH5329208.1 Dabb family protein [Aquincola sp.]